MKKDLEYKLDSGLRFFIAGLLTFVVGTGVYSSFIKNIGLYTSFLSTLVTVSAVYENKNRYKK